jgi:hypothetical protein
LTILFKLPDFGSSDLVPGTRNLLRARSLSFTKAALARFEQTTAAKQIVLSSGTRWMHAIDA